jgi:hypothetical protein
MSALLYLNTEAGAGCEQPPEVRVQYDAYLDEIVASRAERHRWQGRLLESIEVEELAAAVQRSWAAVERRVLDGMCDALGLEFRRNLIDVYVVPGIPRAYSNPVLVPLRDPLRLTVGDIAHELLHLLLTENTRRLDVERIWGVMFGVDLDRGVRNHVLVHATLEYVYRHVLYDQALLEWERDCHPGSPYALAWELVDAHGGYLEVIEEFRGFYAPAALAQQHQSR